MQPSWPLKYPDGDPELLFEWMSDPAAWAGLATLVALEIVLGIDNLVFIAILADKLPEHQREEGEADRAFAGSVHAAGAARIDRLGSSH